MGFFRLLLAFSVLATHSSPIFDTPLIPGKDAVNIFFIVSGFYMAFTYSSKYIYFPVYSFYLNRGLRIFPLYWIILITTLLLLVVQFYYTHDCPIEYCFQDFIHMGWVAQSIIVFSNLFIFGQDILSFFGYDALTSSIRFNPFDTGMLNLNLFLVLPQAWSLSTELMFYLLVPLLCKKRFLIPILLCLSQGLQYILPEYGYVSYFWAYRFFPSELVYFLFGMSVYFISQDDFYGIRVKDMIQLSMEYLKKLFGKYYLVSIYLFVFFLCITYRNYWEFYSAEKVFLILISIGIPCIFYSTSRSKLDRFLGELSYPVYISHIFIGLILANITNVTGLKLAIATFVFSILLYFICIRRIEKYRVFPQKHAL